MSEKHTITHYPPIGEDRAPVESQVARVTLLEDRANVTREGVITLKAGTHRLVLSDVAPILQDVSLRAEIETSAGAIARITDARVKRATRALIEHKPEDVAALEEKLEALVHAFEVARSRRGRTGARLERTVEMIGHGLAEIPKDTAWGIVDREAWEETFETLFERARTLRQEGLAHYHDQLDIHQSVLRTIFERAAIDQPNHQFVACIEIDVVVEQTEGFEEAEFTLTASYVVPNAMWRPTHSVRLHEGEAKATFTSSGAVWQNTGEDWVDAELTFSTARSSLGTDPPLLSDDLLTATRKASELRIEARQVEVQSATVGGGGGGGAPAPAGVELPGVDDGGDIQNLKAIDPVTIRSDGRPSFIPIFSFEAEVEATRLSRPEFDAKVFLRAFLDNTSSHPLLAGPVELIRGSEIVGETKVLYVAPGERFELSFGPEYDLQLLRVTHPISDEVDEVDKWRRRVTDLHIFLSNLSAQEYRLTIEERIPTSEIEHVRIRVLEEHTNYTPEIDENGFCRWDAVVPPMERRQISMRWEMAIAPGVEGL